MKTVDEETQRLLKTICDHFDQEDREVRERQLKVWRRLKLIWEGFQHIYYDEVAHDWRIWDEDTQGSRDAGSYDKPINVFRAYLESIIAALSVTVPPIKCFPDDAENPLDLSTAKAGDQIAQLIYRHNDAPLLWLHALYIFCTEGMTAAYCYPKEDIEYGTYDIEKHENFTEYKRICPQCNRNLPEELFAIQTSDEFLPYEPVSSIACPDCQMQLDPAMEMQPFTVNKLVGITKEPKSRIITEVYGGLYVKVPNYAMKQADIPYLIFSYETHYTNALDRYPELRKKGEAIVGSGQDQFEQWARLSPQYHGDIPVNTVTVRNCWLRPSSFNVINNEEDVKKLKRLFPSGAKVVLVNDQFAEACNEKLDDVWTLTSNPLSDYLHHDPIGLSLTPVQEITNDMISLVLQTIEHGIPQTFADPKVLNFEKYSQSEVIPGGVYPATPTTGKTVSDGFYEVKTSTLSPEVLPFFEKIQELGQLVSGATPSLFGGQLNGSKTASEYSMSRSQALQRLQNNWKMFTIWWKTVYGKAIPMYIKEMKDDEHSVERDQQGGFINAFIRKAEVEGKIGRVELEANENLPLTWSQQKDVIMEMLQMQNENIMAMLGSPENIPLMQDAIGLTNFVVPGAADREKQFEEIKILIASEPIMVPPDPMVMQEQAAMGMMPSMEPTEIPSVEVDPLVDNHNIEAEICRSYLISETGRQLKIKNPQGYKNVLLHMKAHMDVLSEMMMQQQAAATSPDQSQSPKPEGSSSPLAEQENVSTVN